MYFERKRENGDEINSLFKLKRAEINAIQYANQADLLNDLTDREEIIDLATEQTKDDEIMHAIEWKRNNLSSNLKYASRRLKKYVRKFDRLEIENNTLYRQFFDGTGKLIFKEYCLPKHLWKEVIYRLHNSPTGGHLGILRTTQEFRKRFYYPGFTEHFIDFIKNCITCLPTAQANNEQATATTITACIFTTVIPRRNDADRLS